MRKARYPSSPSYLFLWVVLRYWASAWGMSCMSHKHSQKQKRKETGSEKKSNRNQPAHQKVFMKYKISLIGEVEAETIKQACQKFYKEITEGHTETANIDWHNLFTVESEDGRKRLFDFCDYNRDGRWRLTQPDRSGECP